MADNNQPVGLDEELKKVQQLNEGFVDPNEPEKPEEKKEEEPPQKKEEEIKPEPVKPEVEKEPEDVPELKPKPVVEPEKPEIKPEVKPEVKPEPQPKPESRKRPETYIPIPQYKSEKEQWNTEKKILEDKIVELQTIAKDTKKDSPTEDEEIKAIAEKYGYEFNAVKDFVNIARKGMEIPKEKLELIDQAQKSKQLEAEQAHYAQEWTNVEPSVKQLFPTALPEQLAEAKKLLDQISHTPKYADKDLDYIIFKEKAQFEPLFTASPVKPNEGPKGKTLDGVKIQRTGPVELSAKDFPKNDDFKKLDDLTKEEKDKIVSAFDPLTYDRYVAFESFRDDNAVEVQRDGRTIRLK